MILTRFRLSTRILLTGTVVAIVFPVLLFTWLLPEQRATGYRMKADATRVVVEAACGVLDHYVKQAGVGAMTLAQAQSAARETLRQARFEGGNYVWINDSQPAMLMHPAKPEMEGQDLSSFRDPNGVALFLEAVRVARTAGEGEIRYMWPKPGNKDPLPKISYVKLSPAWGWIVGAGMYVDDVEASLRHSRNIMLLIVLLDLAGSVLLSYLMARSLTAPLRRAAARLTQFAGESSVAVSQVSGASQTVAAGMSEQAA